MCSENCIGLNGDEVEESFAFAKLVSNSDKNFYLILMYNASPANPYNEVFTLSKRRISKFVKVDESVYRNYVLFLKTKKDIYYNRTKRMMG